MHYTVSLSLSVGLGSLPSHSMHYTVPISVFIKIIRIICLQIFLHQQLTMPSLCKTYCTAFESTGDAAGNYMLPTLEATNLEPAADGGYAISTWVAVPKPQRSSSSSGSCVRQSQTKRKLISETLVKLILVVLS